MKDLIFKKLLRILALLGCTSTITACYGTPYSGWNPEIRGNVTDANTGNPIPGIRVTVKSTVPASSASGTSAESDMEYTDCNGEFRLSRPDLNVVIECTDVDEDLNGRYLKRQEIVGSMYSGQEISIKMYPVNE